MKILSIIKRFFHTRIIRRLTCLYMPFLPKNEMVVPPIMDVTPAPAQSNMVSPKTAVRGRSLICIGSVTHSFQLILVLFRIRNINMLRICESIRSFTWFSLWMLCTMLSLVVQVVRHCWTLAFVPLGTDNPPSKDQRTAAMVPLIAVHMLVCS